MIVFLTCIRHQFQAAAEEDHVASRNLSSGQFPTMGEAAISVSYRQAEPGRLVPRHMGQEVPEPATAASRTQVHERHGHVGAVQVYRQYSNAPEAAGTGRRVTPLPVSHNGKAEFDTRRTYGQGA